MKIPITIFSNTIGIIKSNEDKFKLRKDRWHFERIAYKYKDDTQNFILANIVTSESFWPKDIMKKQTHDIFLSWKRRTENTEETLTNDIKIIINEVGKNHWLSFSLKILNVGSHPQLLRLYYAKQISLETLTIFYVIFDLENYWNGDLKNDIMWNKTKKLLMKYKPFLKLSDPVVKDLCKKVILNNITGVC